MRLRLSKFSHRQEATALNKHKLTKEQELELINKFTRTPLTQEQVYIFPVTLCDNEIDRDFECFSEKALTALEALFVGKTGISDHSMRSEDQAARIFHCYTHEDASLKTATGKSYTALKALAYMVRTSSNADLIKEIDAGIKKEVSVGCAAGKVICSICGKNMKAHECTHIKGKTYKGRLCYGILTDITDAYEWSFVAVPAQRNAGVTKSFNTKEEKKLNTVDIIKSMTEDTTLTPSQAQELCNYIASLEALAEDAKHYKNQLLEDISRSALIIMPGVSIKHFSESCALMEIPKLKKLRDDLAKQAGDVLPHSLQLKPANEKHSPDNKDFII